MLLCHIHSANCPTVADELLSHTVYTNGLWHLSDLFPSNAPSSRRRFSVKGSAALPNAPKLTDTLREINLATEQLEHLDVIPFQSEYRFAIDASALIRFKSEVRCRSVCWAEPNQFAMIGWGNKNNFGIKIRHNESVYQWSSASRLWEAVLFENPRQEHRVHGSVYNSLAWQFHQKTHYELSPRDVEELSNSNLANTDWKVAD